MSICMGLHNWGRWEDVKIGDEVKDYAHHAGIVVVRQVIKQQRRCTRCNMVKTRHSA